MNTKPKRLRASAGDRCPAQLMAGGTGENPMKKLTEKKRRDLEAFEALPPSIREYLLAYAAGMVAGAELKKKATA